MAIGLIIAAVAAGLVGAGSHMSAKDTNERAQKLAEDAKAMYDDCKAELEKSRAETEKALLTYGTNKKSVLNHSMKVFLNAYEKIKYVSVVQSQGIDELNNYVFDEQSEITIRNMTDLYSKSLASGAAGAAAGTLVALAATGGLPIVASGVSTAASLLSFGSAGLAASTIGTSLSIGLMGTPVVAIAAPVVLFTGISASIKADENLEKAQTMYAESEEACQKMETAEILCNAITEKSVMMNDLLNKLNTMLLKCSVLLTGVVQSKVGNINNRRITSEDFTEAELKLIAVTRSLAGAVKAILDTPLLDSDGEINSKAENVYESTNNMIPMFAQSTEEVCSVDYRRKKNTAKNNIGINPEKKQVQYPEFTEKQIKLLNIFSKILLFGSILPFLCGVIYMSVFWIAAGLLLSTNINKKMSLRNRVTIAVILFLL